MENRIREDAQVKLLRLCHSKTGNERPKSSSPLSFLESVFAFAVTQHFAGRTATDFFIMKLRIAGTEGKSCKDVNILIFHLRSFNLKPNIFLIYVN